MKIKYVSRFFGIFFLFLFTFIYAQNETDLSDPGITAMVRYKISVNPLLKKTRIHVSTSNSIVKLKGEVDSVSQFSVATELAQSTPGVKDVDAASLTIVGSHQPISDALITAKIKGLFIQHKLFSSADIAAITINVETNNGIVILTGNADNSEQVENAIKVAKSVDGVREVKSNIKVVAH